MALLYSTAQVQNRENTVHPIQRRAVIASEFFNKTRLQDPVFAHAAEFSEKGLCHTEPCQGCSNTLSAYLQPGKAEDTAQCRKH